MYSFLCIFCSCICRFSQIFIFVPLCCMCSDYVHIREVQFFWCPWMFVHGYTSVAPCYAYTSVIEILKFSLCFLSSQWRALLKYVARCGVQLSWWQNAVNQIVSRTSWILDDMWYLYTRQLILSSVTHLLGNFHCTLLQLVCILKSVADSS